MFVPPTISCETATDAALASLLTDCGRWRAQLEAFEATVLAEFERRRVATAEGCADTAAWLARHAQSAAGAARSRVERATALAALPGASAAFAAGRLGADHAAVVARATREVGADVVAAAEDELLGWVPGTTPEQFGRRVRRWINRHRIDTGTTPADATRAERRLSLRTDAVAGTGHLHAELPVADHTLVADTLWGLVEEQLGAPSTATPPRCPTAWSSRPSSASPTPSSRWPDAPRVPPSPTATAPGPRSPSSSMPTPSPAACTKVATASSPTAPRWRPTPLAASPAKPT